MSSQSAISLTPAEVLENLTLNYNIILCEWIAQQHFQWKMSAPENVKMSGKIRQIGTNHPKITEIYFILDIELKVMSGYYPWSINCLNGLSKNMQIWRQKLPPKSLPSFACLSLSLQIWQNASVKNAILWVFVFSPASPTSPCCLLCF